MAERMAGYYWVDWTDLVDPEIMVHRPGALVGFWDGEVWWFVRMRSYRFDCEVKVLGECLAPPVALMAVGA